MTSRRVQLVIVCEDSQHESFVIRFLKKRGWNSRQIRVEKAPPGQGSGEQFVRMRFPSELDAVRQGHVARRLLVMGDGDASGREERIRQFDEACDAAGIETRREDDPAAVIVPTWAIETWLAYLDGQDVDEESTYPRLDRARECQRHVDALDAMCQKGTLRQPAPPSLKAACDEFRTRILEPTP